MSIQLFVPTFDVDECLNQIRDCLEKGWTGLGYKTVEFEEAWKKYTGLLHFIHSLTCIQRENTKYLSVLAPPAM